MTTPGLPFKHFHSLYGDLESFADMRAADRPSHLAHYTSLEVVESILKSREIWLSHPFFMNDHEEMIAGLRTGLEIIHGDQNRERFNDLIGGAERYAQFMMSFNHHFGQIDSQHILNFYIFCLSEFDINGDGNGQLSMWRGYGADGGGGAIVFSLDFLAVNPTSPLLVTKVKYAHAYERHNLLNKKLADCLEICRDLLANSIYNQQEILNDAALHLCEIMILLSLSLKDKGFEEEKEWRLVYFPHRDKENMLTKYIGYHINDGKIEPKLKMPMKPLPNVDPRSWSLEEIIALIILGPTQNHWLPGLPTQMAKRMVKQLGFPALVDKIRASTIPYRPSGGRG